MVRMSVCATEKLTFSMYCIHVWLKLSLLIQIPPEVSRTTLMAHFSSIKKNSYCRNLDHSYDAPYWHHPSPEHSYSSSDLKVISNSAKSNISTVTTSLLSIWQWYFLWVKNYKWEALHHLSRHTIRGTRWFQKRQILHWLCLLTETTGYEKAFDKMNTCTLFNIMMKRVYPRHWFKSLQVPTAL